MYSEDERRIFGPYANGTGNMVFCDPLAAKRKLNIVAGGDLNGLIAMYNGEDQAARGMAIEQLAQAAVVAFSLMPFDPLTGQGVTEGESMSVLRHFLDWLEKKNPSIEISPTSPAPTAGESRDRRAGQLTRSGSGSS